MEKGKESATLEQIRAGQRKWVYGGIATFATVEIGSIFMDIASNPRMSTSELLLRFVLRTVSAAGVGITGLGLVELIETIKPHVHPGISSRIDNLSRRYEAHQHPKLLSLLDDEVRQRRKLAHNFERHILGPPDTTKPQSVRIPLHLPLDAQIAHQYQELDVKGKYLQSLKDLGLTESTTSLLVRQASDTRLQHLPKPKSLAGLRVFLAYNIPLEGLDFKTMKELRAKISPIMFPKDSQEFEQLTSLEKRNIEDHQITFL